MVIRGLHIHCVTSRTTTAVAVSLIENIGLMYGVDDGARTHDDRNHNPGLYQLSYVHHNSLYAGVVWYAWQDSNLLPSA